jgi:hypothetical protein
MVATTATRSSNNNMASVNNGDKNIVSRNGSSIGVVEEQEQQHRQQQHDSDDGATRNSGRPVDAGSTNTTTTRLARGGIRGGAGTGTGTGTAGFGSTSPRGSDWKSPIMTHFGGGETRKRSTTTAVQPTNDEGAGEDDCVVQPSATCLNDLMEAVLAEEAMASPDDSTRKNNVPQSSPERGEGVRTPAAAAASAFPFSLSLSDEELDRAATTTTTTTTAKSSSSSSSASKNAAVTASALSAEHPLGSNPNCDPPPPARRLRRERSDSLKLHELEADDVTESEQVVLPNIPRQIQVAALLWPNKWWPRILPPSTKSF